MNFTYENQGTNTFLVYTVSSEDIIDTMSLGMLTNNKIAGLATSAFTQLDATKYIKYNVSARVSVKQFFAGAVNRKRLLGVFNGIVDAMLSAEDYMIDAKSILLDLDYIFTDVSTCETVLICLPVDNKVIGSNDLGSFFKNIMFTTQFDQTENCDHVAKIINYLNSAPGFSLVDFKEVLNEFCQENAVVEEPPRTEQIPQQTVAQAIPISQPVQQPVQPTVMQQSVQQSVPQSVRQSQQSPQPVVTPQQSPQPVVTAQQRPQPVVTPKSAPQLALQHTATNEKRISMWYLLQHYNKENAAIYKAQKAAKKATAATKAVPAPGTISIPNSSMPIPGQPNAMPQPVQIPKPTSVQMPQSMPTPQQTPQTVPQAAPQPVPQIAPVQVSTAGVSEGRNANFGETTVLSDGPKAGETTVLGASAMVEQKPHLIRAKTNERINLDKPVFRIGKEKSYVDYFVSDNTAISRSHANIISRNGEYFVVDTNSTNHTYVNGNMIQSSVETKIAHGAKIKFANENFEFKLY